MSDTLCYGTDPEWGDFSLSRHCGAIRKDGGDRRIITIYYGPGDDTVSIPIDIAVKMALAILSDKTKT